MPLLLLVPFALLALPLIEIALFIWIGEAIGILPTLVLTVGAIVLGAALAAREGFATVRKARESLDHGEIPVDEILSGALLMLAAALMMTPGFLTAAAGFILLIRPIRLWAGRRLFARLLAARGRSGGPGMRSGPKTIELRTYTFDPDRR